MVCTKCGSIIPDGYTSCAYCGTPVNNSIPQNPVQPVVQPVQSAPFVRKNGMATTGLIFGIIAIALSTLLSAFGKFDDSVVGMTVSVYFSGMVMGIIFSSIGISKSRIFGGKGKAVTGLILSISSFLLFIVSMATMSAGV